MVGGVAPSDGGYLATVFCKGAIRRAHLPPPTLYTCYTIALGARGEPGEIRPTDNRSGWSLVVLGGSLYTSLFNDGPVNIARVTRGRLFDPLPLSFGEPDALPVALVPAKEGAVALWRGGETSVDAASRALHATHLTPNGVDPAMYGRIVAMNGYAAASNGREMLVAESMVTATA